MTKRLNSQEEEAILALMLVAKGYSEQEAIKAVADVNQARKDAREAEVRKYVGKRVIAEFDGLNFEVVVKDVKLNLLGKFEFQVTPLNGQKHAWVKEIKLQ